MPNDSSPLSAAKPVAFLGVADRDRALSFYRDTLGLELHSSDSYGDFLTMNGALLRITVLPDLKAHPHPVVGWDVEDISAVAATLAKRGIAFTRYEGMDQDELGIWSSPDGGSKLAFFADPDGNVLTLSQG